MSATTIAQKIGAETVLVRSVVVALASSLDPLEIVASASFGLSSSTGSAEV